VAGCRASVGTERGVIRMESTSAEKVFEGMESPFFAMNREPDVHDSTSCTCLVGLDCAFGRGRVRRSNAC